MTGERAAGEADIIEPEAAFHLLADGTRARIVQELGGAWSDDWPGVVGYADLMERVGAQDSGRFNYHLSQLVGRYVSRKAEGYKLDYHGLRVYRAIVAGTFTDDVTIDAFAVDADCFDCGAGLEASYADTIASVRCSDCGTRYGEYALPPRGATERSRADLLVAADRRMRHLQSLFLDGVCPWCGSVPDTRLERSDDSDLASWAETGFDLHVVHQCGACGGLLGHSVGHRVLHHPAVVSFFHDHGVDPSSIPSWDLSFAVTDRHTTVHATDPWRVEVDVPVDGAVLTVRLDESLAVLDATRSDEHTTST